MTQATNVIADGSGATVLAALNAALAALQSANSGTAFPSYAVLGTECFRTDIPGSGTGTLYRYDGANWIAIGTLNTTTHVWTPVGGSANYALASGFMNKLRNGSFLSWPQGLSGTIAAAATGAACIAASGWAVLATGASVTWAQVQAGTNGAGQSLKVVGNTSVTDITIGQRIESADGAALAGQQVTFQAAIFNNTGASITPTIATRYAGTMDSWGSPVADLAATALQACPNNAWTIVSYTFPCSANAANGYEVKLDFGNNFSTTSKYLQITGADMRATPGLATGLNAAPPSPEFRDVANELLRCARYFDCSYENGTAPGAATYVGMYHFAMNSGSSQGHGTVKWTVPMRAAPTFTYWDGAGNSSKISSYGNTTTTRTDNLTPNPTPWNASKQAIQVGGDSTGSADKFLHYTAYADFW